MKTIVRGFALALALSLVSVAHATTDWSAQDYDLYSGDFDGDGKTDLLYIAKDASKPSGIARSDGTAPNIPWQSWPSNYLGIPWSNGSYSVIVADLITTENLTSICSRKIQVTDTSSLLIHKASSLE